MLLVDWFLTLYSTMLILHLESVYLLSSISQLFGGIVEGRIINYEQATINNSICFVHGRWDC